MSKIPLDRTAKAGNHELIGPASATISLRDFLEEARSTIPFWRETDIGKDITEAPFAGLSPGERAQLEARCSCNAIREETQTFFNDDGLLTDLKLWQWARLYTGSDDVDLLNKAVLENASSATRNKAAQLVQAAGKESKRAKKAAAAAAAAEEEAEQAVDILIDPSLQASPAPPSPAPGTPQTDSAAPSNRAPEGEINPITGKRKRAPPTQIVEPAILETIVPLQTKIQNAGLKHYGTFYEASAYMRRIRQSDYQSLSHLRVASAPEQFMFTQDVPMPNAVGHEPELVITIAFHPIPNRISPDKDIAPNVPRLQKSCFLGSQTLSSLRDALVCTSAAVPTERDSMHEVDLLLAGTQTVLMDDDPSSVKWRYVNDKWKAGAVVMLDGKLYGDTRPGMRDYAADLETVVADLNWTTDANPLDPALQPQPEISTTYEPQYEFNPISQSAPEVESEDGARPTKKLKLTPSSYSLTGKALHETTFYDILDGIKLGEPCWLMHHGNCEHVFVFEEIRLLHTSDPPPVMPLGADQQPVSPYPVTTYLSRLNVNKCNICERDPVTCVTVNDELAGTSPCPCCNECFRLLHGDLEGAKAKGVEVIGILEELETG